MALHITRPGIVVPVAADPEGLLGPTPGRARGRRWRTTSPGRFVPASVDPTATEQRIVEAVDGVDGGCGVTGWASLAWQGARWFTGLGPRGEMHPVPVAIGDRLNRAPRTGVVCWRDWLFEGDLVELDGLPMTRPERTVCAAALRARNLDDTVRVLAMACADDVVSLDEIARYATRIKGRPHTRRLAEALVHADENLWSPQEVTLLMRWRHGRPTATTLCNAPVFDDAGRHLFTPDLIDPAAGVIGQYDGVVHDQVRVRRRDLAVEELCRDLGLEVVTMISTDLRDLSAFDARLAAAYARAARRRTATGWTLEQPPWWTDTSTVAARRALDAAARRRWLPHAG